MKKILNVSAIFCLLCVSLFFLQLTYSVWQITPVLSRSINEYGMTAKQVRWTMVDVASSVNDLSFAVRGSISEVARSVQMVQQHADRVLTEAGLTAMEARKASHEQREYMSTAVPRLAAKLENTLDNTNAALAQTTSTMTKAGEVIGDPNIPKTLGNIQSSTADAAKITAHGAVTMEHVEHIATNADKKMDEFMKPVHWAKNALFIGAKVVGKFFGF